MFRVSVELLFSLTFMVRRFLQIGCLRFLKDTLRK
jgi:hypothetical protein